jgi:hypothetical protein
MIGTPPPSDALADAAAEYDARVAALIAQDDDLVEYVARLETLVDSEAFGTAGDDAEEEAADVDPGDLVAEVERFLRDRDA